MQIKRYASSLGPLPLPMEVSTAIGNTHDRVRFFARWKGRRSPRLTSSRLTSSRLCLGAERRRAWMRHDNYDDNDRGHETGSIGAGLGRISCFSKGCAPSAAPTSLRDVTYGFPINCHLRNDCARIYRICSFDEFKLFIFKNCESYLNS